MTTNLDYLYKQITNNDLIWIDTCTMMYTQRFQLFIKKVRPILIETNKKIQIPDCVMAELAKHQLSSDEYKRACATDALNLIKENNYIFNVEHLENNASNGENFADPQILTVILEKRRNTPQLLISNDQRLTSDAYKFNNIESFNGSRISVCYIGSNGDMNMCDCVRGNIFESQPEIIYKDRIIIKEVTNDTPSQKATHKFTDFINGVITGTTLACIACNLKKITKFTKHLIK